VEKEEKDSNGERERVLKVKKGDAGQKENRTRRAGRGSREAAAGSRRCMK